MKLGPRVAIVTTFLMAAVLASVTWAALATLRTDQMRSLDREAHELAATLAAGIEPLEPADAGQVLRQWVQWAADQNTSFRLEAVAWGTQRPNNSWAGLVEEATRADGPVGRVFSSDDKAPFYALALPIHNAQPGTPARQIVAFLGLVRDGSFVPREMRSTVRRLAPLLVLGVLAFGVLVFIILRQRLATPLRQLVEAIDGVSQGDMSRAVLPERDDEIGSLAARFNAMMSYLREAQEREARANASRHTLETHLRRAEKLATVGQLAAEIAHEVGTPLNVIGGRARSLAKRASDPDVQKNAEIISAQVDRITKIIRQVLDSSRKSRPSLSEVDVLRVVREALEFVDGMLRRNHIEVIVSPAPALRPIAGDPDEIQQVCLNLIVNAIHAMPEGGKLTVNVNLVTRRKEGLELSPPSPYLMLEIGDTGPGVPAADREKIFEAFFTTKEAGVGSGLGLAVTKGIVKDHEGWIEVDDAPEGGALFRVFLPADPHPPAGVSDGPAADTPAPQLFPAKPLPNAQG